jgi:hypothetical protein
VGQALEHSIVGQTDETRWDPVLDGLASLGGRDDNRSGRANTHLSARKLCVEFHTRTCTRG